MKFINLFLIFLTACLMCIDTTSGLSLHVVTAPIVTAFLLSWPTSFLPNKIRELLGMGLGEVVIAICLVDCYCQEFFLTPITPQILSNVLLSDSRECWEFLSAFINIHVLTHWRILLEVLLAVILPLSYLKVFQRRASINCNQLCRRILIAILAVCFVYEIPSAYKFFQLFRQDDDLQKIEGLIFRHYHEEIPTPLHRFVFAWYSLKISSQQLANIKHTTFSAQIDNCTHLSPHIVLVIGESYNKHHSTLYGYQLPTTPMQQKRLDNGELYVFHDVVSPWNITSNAFLNLFSTWEYGMAEPMITHPMFPLLFRRAGYSVNFFSNQYLLKGFYKGATNQAGHFFLADGEMSDSLFTFRNRKGNKYDMGLVGQVSDFKNNRKQTECTLDIIHLIGQHFDYSLRYPKSEVFFSANDYAHKNISIEAKEIVMHYDNATYYNDMVLDSIINTYKYDNAIIIFVSDHGEEVYDDLNVHGRLFQEPTAIQAKYEFEVPMWIWCSESYRCSHPDIMQQIEQSLDKPFMTDGLPQFLLYIAGISSKWNEDGRNLLSPKYQCKKRIICGSTDYDHLICQ